MSLLKGLATAAAGCRRSDLSGPERSDLMRTEPALHRWRLRMLALVTLLAVGLGAAVVAAEPPAWPQFRGPDGSGVAPAAAKPPTRIGPETNVKWKVAVPAGLSSPVIAGDRLFLTGFEGGKLFALAYRRSDGA